MDTTTRKMVYMESKAVDGKIYVIHSMKLLGYNGVWEDDGFDVHCDGNMVNYVGYPGEKDLKDFINRVKK